LSKTAALILDTPARFFLRLLDRSKLGEWLGSCYSFVSKTNERKLYQIARGRSPVAARRNTKFMTAQSLISLIEEMMDLKVQQYAESQMKLTPEVAPLLKEKRETDKRRLEQIKSELVRFLETS
jgi:hypothetical protein